MRAVIIIYKLAVVIFVCRFLGQISVPQIQLRNDKLLTAQKLYST